MKRLEIWFEKRIRRPKITIGMASAGIVLFLFWPATYISSVLHSHYNPLGQTISRLEIGPGSAVEKAALFLVGVLIIIFTICLYSYIRPPKSKTFHAGILFFFAVGAGTMTIAFIPPVSIKSGGLAHTLLSIIIFVSFPIACFLQARQYREEGWRIIFMYTIIAGILGSIFDIGFLISPKGWSGLAERLILLNGMLWYGIMGSYIIYHALKYGFKVSVNLFSDRKN